MLLPQRIDGAFRTCFHGASRVSIPSPQARQYYHRCFSSDYIPGPHDASFDLITATWTIIASCPIQWQFQHIKGHQDDDPTRELDHWAILNIAMDLRAKAAWEKFHQQGCPTQARIYGEPWPLVIGPRKVCQDLHQQVINHFHGTTARQWWARRNHFPESHLSGIDWDACGRALKSSTRGRRHWVVKHNSRFCAVSRNMARWHQWPQSNCPRCNSDNETNTHVLLCPEMTATTTWLTAIQRLERWMLSQKTEPGICSVICKNLLAWRSHTEPARTTSHFCGLAGALQAQTTIGWKAPVSYTHLTLPTILRV